MTSMAAESVSTILVSCKQTRFHIANPDYRELDIEGLTITVTSSAGEKAGLKGKAKARAEGTEVLNNAKLRLKPGTKYALVGRNGSGKSTLLKAIAEKLIPGIPEQTRVSILQQTDVTDTNTDDFGPRGSADGTGGSASDGPTVLEEVIDKATAKSELEREISVLSAGVSSTEPHGASRALRHIRHERMQKRLFVLDKDARLRSGARGSAARKALVEYEKEVAEYAVIKEQNTEDISAETLQAEAQEAADMLAELQIQVEPSRLADFESKAKKILTGLGFTDAYMSRAVSSLSGGWKMRTALATVLLTETDILILDEPTNFLDLLGIIWLQKYLQSLDDTPDPPTLIMVSHDRDFITICSDLLMIKDKGLTYFHGDLPTYEESQAERKLWLRKMKDAADKQKAHIQETIHKNMVAGKKNDDTNKIRQAKSRQKKLDDRWGMQVNAKGHRLKLNRDMEGYHFTAREAIDIPPDERPVTLVLPEPPDLRFPGALITLEGADFRYGSKGKSKLKSQADTPATLQDVSLSIHMGDRIGILGLNGAGKSTLIKLLVESEKPTKGTVTTHPRLKLGYYSQHAVEELQALANDEPELTALSLLIREVAGELDEGEVRGMLGSLGLPGRIASDIPIRKLSGGQLVRCELARLLWKRPHCLILDEVTTHLDYETVTALREVLRDWEGAAVVVSHDRWFIRGAIEGMTDEEGSEGEDDVGEEESPRRRAVFRLKAGKLVALPGGVQDFEDVMEKRVKKLLSA